MTGGYSDNVAQMQTNTNPGAVGAESLATTLAGELERIRYQIRQMLGSAQWYSAPAATLAGLAGAGVPDNSITNLKLADMATKTIKARNTAATGDPEDVSFSTLMDFVGSAANGDILFRTGGAWSRLPIGSSGNLLQVSGGVPAWGAFSSSITPTVDIRTGSATITIPAGATKCLVYLDGAGAGSGGAKAISSCCGTEVGIGGSGGGGASLVKYLTGLTPGNTLSLTIGAAGTAGGGNPPTNGGNGGNTVLSSGTQVITTLTAAGGALGVAGNGTQGASGIGGNATNGDFNLAGQSGQSTGNNHSTSNTTRLSSRGGDSGGGRGVGGGSENIVNNTNVTGQQGLGLGGGAAGGLSTSTAAAGSPGNTGAPGGAMFVWFP
jgi:hypothetical protein